MPINRVYVAFVRGLRYAVLCGGVLILGVCEKTVYLYQDI